MSPCSRLVAAMFACSIAPVGGQIVAVYHDIVST
jgi:hypothetical protein